MNPSTGQKQPGSLKLIAKHTHLIISDILTMPATLTHLAQAYRRQGYTVNWRGPVVVLLLPDGEVHFCPDGRRVVQYIFQKN